MSTPSMKNEFGVRKDGEWIWFYEDLHIVLLDGYDLGVPEVKTYVVDIPGGHGNLDITESVYGDTPLQNRQQTFNFMSFDLKDANEFEEKKNLIMKMFHGYTFKYRLNNDKYYYYEGRFNVSLPSFSNTANRGLVMSFTITVDAKPFKIKTTKRHIETSAVGGVTVNIDNGRKKVLPTIQLPAETYISFEKKEWTVGPGTVVINDLILKEGLNQIYLNSYRINFAKWSDLFKVSTGTYKPEGYNNKYKHLVYTNNKAVLDHLSTQSDFLAYIKTKFDTPKIDNRTITWTEKGNYVGMFYSDSTDFPSPSDFKWSFVTSSEHPEIIGPKWSDLTDNNTTFNDLMTLSGNFLSKLKSTNTNWRMIGDFTWDQISNSTWASLAELEDFKQNVNQTPVIIEWEVGEI